jgi:hypothetical protein
MHEHTLEHHSPEDGATVSTSHIIRILKGYIPIIVLAMAGVAVLYGIVALAVYLLAPSSRVTSLPFRLDWEGAAAGQYPNGEKFSPVEIVSTPVLVKTFNDNNLSRYTSYEDFTKSVVVLQANPAMEALAREYQARLADTRLSAVDRERIQREYELKLGSISKNAYALHYVREGRKRDRIPETVVGKVIQDILRNWANFAANERHVLEYRVAVLSPDVVSAAATGGSNPIIDIVMMRDKVQRLMFNIGQIRRLPAAELARTKDGLTLTDLQIRLDDVIRYRLDPLVIRIAGASMDNRTETIRFLEAQLATDERRLQAQTQKVGAVQETLAVYMDAQRSEPAPDLTGTSGQPPARRTQDETVMPQINEGFLDRLMQLAARSVDSEFRQRLAEEYRTESLLVGPMQETVAYDRDVLALIRSTNGGSSTPPAAVASSIATLRSDVRTLAVKIGEIHKNVSENLTPAAGLLTTYATSARVERGVSLKRLAMYGILTLAIALPTLVVLCLLHANIKREEDEEAHEHAADHSPSAIESR